MNNFNTEQGEHYENLKEFVIQKLKEYNIDKVKCVDHIENAFAIYSIIGKYKKRYEIFNETLVIECIICHDNILNIYDFLDKEDQLKYRKIYEFAKKNK